MDVNRSRSSAWSPAQRNRSRQRLFRLALLAGAVATALAIAEGGVRLSGIDRPRPDLGVAPHPLWHHWHRPDHAFDFHVAAEGISRRIHFNHLGMRDSRDIAIAKRAGVFRVAVLGDSFVEAMQVEEDEGVCRRLEAYLRTGDARVVEVLNFGCSGFSSTLEWVQAQSWVRDFSPDLVICLHHFSDMSEDWSFSSRMRRTGDRLQAVAPSESDWGRQARQVMEGSQLFRVARGALDHWRRHRPAGADASLQETFDAVVHDPYTPADEQAWDYSLRAVADMAEFFQAADIPFLVVLIPIGTQVEPVGRACAEQLGFRYLAAGDRLEYRGYQRKVTGYCRQKDIACLDLLDDFRTANPQGRAWLYLPHDQHWSGAGHDLAARTIAARIRQRPMP